MVKQVRIIRNVFVMGAMFVGVLWLVRNYIFENWDALLLGALTGIFCGLLYWWRLSRRVSRKDRRFERNKIFVRFLSVFEVALTAAASSHYLLIALVLLLLIGILLGVLSGHWWTILVSSFGIAWAGVLGTCVVHYECRNGPLYYQYDSCVWLGHEGMLYQAGKVIEPLTPAGKVTVNGELWNAVSLSGEAIETGEEVEVISMKGLTLYVDRISSLGKA